MFIQDEDVTAGGELFAAQSPKDDLTHTRAVKDVAAGVGSVRGTGKVMEPRQDKARWFCIRREVELAKCGFSKDCQGCRVAPSGDEVSRPPGGAPCTSQSPRPHCTFHVTPTPHRLALLSPAVTLDATRHIAFSFGDEFPNLELVSLCLQTRKPWRRMPRAHQSGCDVRRRWTAKTACATRASSIGCKAPPARVEVAQESRDEKMNEAYATNNAENVKPRVEILWEDSTEAISRMEDGNTPVGGPQVSGRGEPPIGGWKTRTRGKRTS